MIAIRYPDLPAADALALLDIAQAGATAGARLNELEADDELDIAGLPVQPSLFGDQVQGRRYRVVADVTNAQTGRTIQVVLDEATSLKMDQILEQFEHNMKEWLDQSPRLQEALAYANEAGLKYVEFLFAERRY